MGVSAERLEKVSASLSDVVVDPGRWSGLLDEISLAMDSDGTAVLPDRADGRFITNPRMEDAFNLYVKEGWHQRDPRRRGISKQLLGSVTSDEDVIGDDEAASDPYYCDFLPRVGLRWWAGLGFHAGPDFYCLALQRTERQGRFSAFEKRAYQTLETRLNEVATLSAAAGNCALAGLTNTLDLIPVAAFTVGRSGHVACSNASAERLFGDALRIRGGRLVIRDPSAAADFERLLLRLRTLPEGWSLGAEPIVVRRGEEPPVVLRALPLDGAARNPFAGASALVVMTEVAPRRGSQPKLLTQVFGLTPAEARLATRLATGESLEDAADVIGVCKETARNQLKSIFGKTDTHRQGELVALLCGLPAVTARTQASD